MKYRHDLFSTATRTFLLSLPLALPLAACSDDAGSTDTDPTSETGDGDGDASGDGDGDTAGDGDGDTAGDGDGDTTGDGDGDTEPDPNFPNCSCDQFEGDCTQASTAEEILIAANSLEDGGTLVIGLGHIELDNQVTIRAENATVCGQGMGTEGSFDEGTVLDFASQQTQSNGIDAVGDNFTVRDLAIVDAKKDGLRVEDSSYVTIQRVRATWRDEDNPDNGAYGLYPVKVTHVLMEDSEAYNSADAGIYVGQCQHAIIRNNIAKGNVAGIEIENTQYADVYGNLAEDNTGGLLIFDLPGNPIIGHDVSVHDNVVINNNRSNFAPGGTVRQIPPGTGTFAMASRRVEIFNNTYENNNSSDIVLLSGLVIEGDPTAWEVTEEELVGDVENCELPTGDGVYYNYETNNILVHGNTHSGSGTNPYNATPDQEFGVLIGILYAGNLPVDNVLYDTLGESAFDTMDPGGNSNDNSLCIGENDAGTFASLNVEVTQGGGDIDSLFRPAAPFTPFDCTQLDMGPIVPPEM